MRDPDTGRRDIVPTAAGTIMRLAYGRLREAQINVTPLLQKSGVTLAQIDDANTRVGVRNQINFLNLAAIELGDELLGFHLAQSFDLREIGFLYYVASSSETLTLALQRIARYTSTINEGVCIKYIDRKNVTVAFDYVGVSRHKDRQQIEFFITALVLLCRKLAGLRIVPRINFTHQSNDRYPELCDFFGDDVSFGALADEVTFAPSISAMPVISADPYLNKLLIAKFDAALSRRSANRKALQSSVENAIVPLLPHGTVKIGVIARMLGMSQRSLARRLSSEGHNFSELLDNLRADLAARYLADEDLSITQIAWLLGYQEVSALTHAYRRWTGSTPREARSQVTLKTSSVIG
jgi:AraC-like DNA-binding protein